MPRVWHIAGFASFCVAVVCLFGLLAARPAGERTSGFPEVVAIVNGNPITGAQLTRRMTQSRAMNPEAFDRMTSEQRSGAVTRLLDSMVLQELKFQEAVKAGMNVSDDEVALALEKTMGGRSNSAAFEKSLSDGQITAEEWKAEMRKTLMIRKLEEKLAAQLAITDGEIERYRAKRGMALDDDAAETAKTRRLLQQLKWTQERPAWTQVLLQQAKIWKAKL